MGVPDAEGEVGQRSQLETNSYDVSNRKQIILSCHIWFHSANKFDESGEERCATRNKTDLRRSNLRKGEKEEDADSTHLEEACQKLERKRQGQFFQLGKIV